MIWGRFMTDKSRALLQSQNFVRRPSAVDESTVVTPTDACPPCNLARIGIVRFLTFLLILTNFEHENYVSVSATPEFIHPRTPNMPRWLMSPPVREQDPSIISYAPMLYHNVGVPSVASIAIPVLGPVTSQVTTTNDDATSMEISSASTMPCNTLMNVGSQEAVQSYRWPQVITSVTVDASHGSVSNFELAKW